MDRNLFWKPREVAGRVYYTMDIADNLAAKGSECCPDTLENRLSLRGAMNAFEAIGIAEALATALDALHAHGLIHRDLKPSNVIFKDGKPLLADSALLPRQMAVRRERLDSCLRRHCLPMPSRCTSHVISTHLAKCCTVCLQMRRQTVSRFCRRNGFCRGSQDGPARALRHAIRGREKARCHLLRSSV